MAPSSSSPSREAAARSIERATVPAVASASADAEVANGIEYDATDGCSRGREGSGGDSLGCNRSMALNDLGELAMARSMSPLLSELFNGKLGTTIETFCQRAANESRTQRRR